MAKRKTKSKGPAATTWTCIESSDPTSDEEEEEEEEEEEDISPPPPPPPPPARTAPRVAPATTSTRPTRPSTQKATQKSKASRNEETLLPAVLKAPREKTYAASWIVQMLEDGSIDVDPEYQRGIVWTESKQTDLINSLYHNFPIPEILFAVHYKDGCERRVCIDGKQRLTSLLKFFHGEIPFKDPSCKRKVWFCKNAQEPRKKILSNAMIQAFKNKGIACKEYDDLTPVQEREAFQRVQYGVPLAPTDRLPAINGPIADLVRELRHRINTTEGFEGYLDWGSSRGKDYQALAQITYLAMHGNTPKKAEPTSTRLESFLSSALAQSDVDKLKHAVFQTMDIFCRIAETEELGEPLTKELSPLEFVMAAYLIFLQRRTLSDTQLSDAITHMRANAKHACIDLKFSKMNFGLVLRFVQKEVPKLVGKLDTDPDDDTPAANIPYQRVVSAGDRFKKLSSHADPDMSSAAATPKPASAGKRKRQDEKDNDDPSESESVVPVKKLKQSGSTQTAIVKKKAQSEAASANQSSKPPRSKLSIRPTNKAKTTIKRSPTKPKASAAPVSTAGITGPSTTKPKNISAETSIQVDEQVGRPSVRPRSRVERSASSFGSNSLECSAHSPLVSTPAPPATNTSFTPHRRPLPSRMSHSDNAVPSPVGVLNMQNLGPLTTPDATPTEVQGGNAVSQFDPGTAVSNVVQPLESAAAAGRSLAGTSTSNDSIGGGQPNKYSKLKFMKCNPTADANLHDGASGSSLPHHDQQPRQQLTPPELHRDVSWANIWQPDSILGPANGNVKNQRPSTSNGMQISTQVPSSDGPSTSNLPPTILSRPTGHNLSPQPTSLLTPATSPQIAPSGSSWNQRHGVGAGRSTAPPTRDPRRVPSRGGGAVNTGGTAAAHAAAAYIIQQSSADMDVDGS